MLEWVGGEKEKRRLGTMGSGYWYRRRWMSRQEHERCGAVRIHPPSQESANGQRYLVQVQSQPIRE